jgi:hypothetical protein
MLTNFYPTTVCPIPEYSSPHRLKLVPTLISKYVCFYEKWKRCDNTLLVLQRFSLENEKWNHSAENNWTCYVYSAEVLYMLAVLVLCVRVIHICLLRTSSLLKQVCLGSAYSSIMIFHPLLSYGLFVHNRFILFNSIQFCVLHMCIFFFLYVSFSYLIQVACENMCICYSHPTHRYPWLHYWNNDYFLISKSFRYVIHIFFLCCVLNLVNRLN